MMFQHQCNKELRNVETTLQNGTSKCINTRCKKLALNFYLQHCSINGLGSCSNEVVTSKVLATTNFDRSCFMLCRQNFDLFTCSTSLVLLYFSSFLVCQRECSSILYACYFSSFAMNVFAFIIRLLTDIWSPHKLNRNLMANLGPKC